MRSLRRDGVGDVVCTRVASLCRLPSGRSRWQKNRSERIFFLTAFLKRFPKNRSSDLSAAQRAPAKRYVCLCTTRDSESVLLLNVQRVRSMGTEKVRVISIV